MNAKLNNQNNQFITVNKTIEMKMWKKIFQQFILWKEIGTEEHPLRLNNITYEGVVGLNK